MCSVNAFSTESPGYNTRQLHIQKKLPRLQDSNLSQDAFLVILIAASKGHSKNPFKNFVCSNVPMHIQEVVAKQVK